MVDTAPADDGEAGLADFLERGELRDDLDPFNDPADAEPFGDVDVIDEQVELDVEPCRPMLPPAKPKYKPGTRQQPAARESAEADGSWWTRPNADFAGEAQRMRVQPRQMKVPGEFNIIGWNAAT